MFENTIAHYVFIGIKEILKMLNIICVQLTGIGLLPLTLVGLFADWVLYYMGFKHDSILRKLVSPFIEKPIEYLLGIANDKIFN